MTGRRITRLVGAALLAALPAAGLAGCAAAAGDLGTPAQQRTETAALLAKASAAQGICFGWRLDSNDPTEAGAGSNLGDSVAVASDPQRCPKWIEVNVRVRYEPESSDYDDTGTFGVRTSSDITAATDIRRGLERLGLDDKAVVNDAAWVTYRAVLALPLLAAETGVAKPAPSPSGQPAAAPSPLPAPGNDFWRDRWGFVAAAAAMVVVAGLVLLIGLVQRRPSPRPPVARR